MIMLVREKIINLRDDNLYREQDIDTSKDIVLANLAITFQRMS